MIRCRSRLTLSALVCVTALAANTAAHAETVVLEVRWLSAAQDDSLLVSDLVIAAHDGNVDFYDHERPVPGDMAPHLETLSRDGVSHDSLVQLMQSHGGVMRGLYGQPFPRLVGTPPPLFPGRLAALPVDPAEHRFLSFIGTIKPSDDAFIGNEDPMQYELFDQNGRFLGPLAIDVMGSQVIDMGLCGNDETGIRLLDTDIEQSCDDGEGIVMPHPGLNGSIRNPDGAPQRVLGGRFTRDGITLNYDAERADFSTPGHRLGRLVIRQVEPRTHYVSGSWYNPERAGEGFNVEWIDAGSESGAPRMIVNWYTYEPGDSGRQVWLAGSGDVGTGPGIPLHRTEGGRFASITNPEAVERIPWGHVTFEFTSCIEGVVRYTPSEAGWPTGSYPIHRLGPVPADAALRCILP